MKAPLHDCIVHMKTPIQWLDFFPTGEPFYHRVPTPTVKHDLNKDCPCGPVLIAFDALDVYYRHYPWLGE